MNATHNPVVGEYSIFINQRLWLIGRKSLSRFVVDFNNYQH